MPLLSPSENYLILSYRTEDEMFFQPHRSPSSSQSAEICTGREGGALEKSHLQPDSDTHY